MSIFLQNGFHVSNEEKEFCNKNNKSSNNIHIFDDLSDLYHKYLFNIIEGKFKPAYCFNEYVYKEDNNNIKLFFDVDILKSSFESSIKNIKSKTYREQLNIQHNNNEVDLSQANILNLLSSFLIEFVYYLKKYKNKTTDIYYNIDAKKRYLLTTFTSQEHITDILQNISITTSNNSAKFSFHIYFNNIYFPSQDIILIRKLIQSFKTYSQHPFKTYLDTQVYKFPPLLRFIYSKKSEDDHSYHIPIITQYIDKHKLNILPDTQIININNLQNYLFTYQEHKNPSILITKKENNFDDIELIFNINDNDISLDNLDFNENPYLYELTLGDIYHMLFNKHTIVLYEVIQALNNAAYFSHTKFVKDLKNEKIYLDFNYEKLLKCCFCDKLSHKNKHVINVTPNGIVIIKEGRSSNCHIKPIAYPNLSIDQICSFIYHTKKCIRRFTTNELIVFTKKNGWELLPEKDPSMLKNILKLYTRDIRSSDKQTIREASTKTLRDSFMALTKEDDPVDTPDPYLFNFKNGVLNLRNNEFIPIADSKEYIIINRTNYPYIAEEDYSPDDKKKEQLLNMVLDQIMPPIIDNEKNYNRYVLEKNLSSIIIPKPKDVITIIRGQTGAGKSTIKNLTKSTLGDDNFIELPIQTYIDPMPLIPNKPDPWLGKIENKSVSFASEPPQDATLNSQRIKLLTEDSIMARLLNSNKTAQQNRISQFIDTNHPLPLNVEDAAGYRRLAYIDFPSSFILKNNEHLVINNKFRYSADSNLGTQIAQGYFKCIFFNILKKWLHQHDQILNFTLENTAHLTHYSLFNESIVKFTISSLVVNIDDLNELYQDHYYKAKIIVAERQVKEILALTKKGFLFRVDNLLKNASWTTNIHNIIKKYYTEDIGHRPFVPLVFFNDIKPEKLNDLINFCNNKNKNNKNLNKTPITLDYYNKNKHLLAYPTHEPYDDDGLNLEIF